MRAPGLRGGDRIDPAVGLDDLAGLGHRVEAGAPFAIVHAATEEQADAAALAVRAAYRLGDTAPDTVPLIRERISP